MTDAVRTVSETDDIRTIEGRIAYGGPFAGRDTYGTTFTPRTDWGLDLHPDGLPVLFNHGFDPDFGLAPIGRTEPTASFRADADGLWVQMQIDKRHKYYATRVKALLDGGQVGLSQGSAEHSLDIDARTGEVRAWPLHEVSLTPTESNPWNVVAARTAEVIKIVQGTRAEMTAKSINDLPDSDFAFIEPGGEKDDEGKTTPRAKRHFPIHDATHVRNALSRAPQSPFGKEAMPKIEAAAKKFDIDTAERTAVRSASSDAAMAAGILQSLFYLRELEMGEDDQVDMLNEAAGAIQKFITAEAAEPEPDIEPGEMAAYMSGVRAGARNSKADQAHIDALHEMSDRLHDHTVALGATAHADATQTTPDEPAEDAARTGGALPTISIVERADPDVVRARMLALAARTGSEVAKRMTG